MVEKDTVRQSSPVVILDPAPKDDALSNHAIGGMIPFIGGAGAGEVIDDGSVLNGLRL